MSDIRPPIAPQKAPPKPSRRKRRRTKVRAPFLPNEPHPHGWVARHKLKTHPDKP